MFKQKKEDFNFDLSPAQILAEIDDLESFHTYMFHKETESLEKEVNLVVSSSYNFEETNDYEIDELQYKSFSKQAWESNSLSNDALLNRSIRMNNSEGDISHQIDDILSSKRMKPNSLADRRDVVNKTILRGFKRFFSSILNKTSKRNSKQTIKPIHHIKSEVIDKAKVLDLLKLKPAESSQDEFEELIYWMSFWKFTTKIKWSFKTQFASIKILDDILTNYSHHKLRNLYLNKEIMSLFEYFIKFGKENFMEEIKRNKESNQVGSGNNFE